MAQHRVAADAAARRARSPLFHVLSYAQGVPDLSMAARLNAGVRPGSLLVVFYIATSTSNAAPFDISAFSSEKSAG